MGKHGARRTARAKKPKTKLGLPDLDHSKAAVLDSLRSLESKRGYRHAIDEFIQWYCSEPRLSFNRVVVTRFRIALENRGLAAGTINGRLAAVRRLAYATEMLRAGVSFPALMKLLGHASPEMTMNYAELTPNDVYREFHELRSPSRHRLPPPKASTASFLADLPSSLHAIQSAQHVLEMFRRTLTEADSVSAVLDRMLNRLTKIAAELRKVATQ